MGTEPPAHLCMRTSGAEGSAAGTYNLFLDTRTPGRPFVAPYGIAYVVEHDADGSMWVSIVPDVEGGSPVKHGDDIVHEYDGMHIVHSVPRSLVARQSATTDLATWTASGAGGEPRRVVQAARVVTSHTHTCVRVAVTPGAPGAYRAGAIAPPARIPMSPGLEVAVANAPPCARVVLRAPPRTAPVRAPVPPIEFRGGLLGPRAAPGGDAMVARVAKRLRADGVLARGGAAEGRYLSAPAPSSGGAGAPPRAILTVGSLRERLQETLGCSICMDLCRKPLLLPCSHIFCSECIQAHMAAASGENVRCPECRSDVPVGMDKVAKMEKAARVLNNVCDLLWTT